MKIKNSIREFVRYPEDYFDTCSIKTINGKKYRRIIRSCLAPYFMLWLRCKKLERLGYKIYIEKIKDNDAIGYNSTYIRAFGYWPKK